MIKTLWKMESVQRYEVEHLVGGSRSDFLDKLIDQICDELFGASLDDLPSWFYEETEQWDNTIELAAWGRARGYELTNEFGQILGCAEAIAYMLEAVERGIVTKNQGRIDKHKDDAWAHALASEAETFQKQRRRAG